MLNEEPVSAEAVAMAPKALANSSRAAPITLGQRIGSAIIRQILPSARAERLGGGKLVAGKRDRHARSYPANHNARRSRDKTLAGALIHWRILSFSCRT